jgi:hypothetical protein
MKITDAFNALNVIAQTPAIRLWLLANDPKALKQVDDALTPISDTDPVTVAARILMERLENICTSFGLRASLPVTGEITARGAYVSVKMPRQEDADAFCVFCKHFVNRHAFVETKVSGMWKCYAVSFLLDEDNI